MKKKKREFRVMRNISGMDDGRELGLGFRVFEVQDEYVVIPAGSYGSYLSWHPVRTKGRRSTNFNAPNSPKGEPHQRVPPRQLSTPKRGSSWLAWS